MILVAKQDFGLMAPFRRDTGQKPGRRLDYGGFSPNALSRDIVFS